MREIQPGHYVACHFPLVGGPAPIAAAPEAADVPAAPVGGTDPVTPVAAPAPAMPEPTSPPPPVTPVAATPPAPAPPPLQPPTLSPPDLDPPRAGAVAAGAALGAAGATALHHDDDTDVKEPAAAEGGWVAPGPVSPSAPPLAEPAVTATRESDDAWLRDAPTPAATDTPRPAVDWTPAVDAAPPVVVPTPAPEPAASVPPPPPPPVAPAPEPAADAAPAAQADAASDADEHLEPPAPQNDRGSIPDVASLDTLLPDRSKGGSINPGR